MTEIPHFRYPKKDELLGYVTQLLGFGRMYVKCSDGKIRLCQVKGSLSRYLWVGEGDLVIVKPWTVEHEKKSRYNVQIRQEFLERPKIKRST